MFILFANATLFAGNTNDYINRARAQQDVITKKILKENAAFLRFKEISTKKITDYQNVIEEIKNKQQIKLEMQGRIKKNEKVIIFVSFSMPELSLKQIIHDAARYQVPVVIRGLYKNSFRKTIEKIFELIKENNKGGIAINPRWFREYNIKAVPAFAITQEYGTKSDIVYGNIPLRKALKMVAEQGEASNTAKEILNKDYKR